MPKIYIVIRRNDSDDNTYDSHKVMKAFINKDNADAYMQEQKEFLQKYVQAIEYHRKLVNNHRHYCGLTVSEKSHWRIR